MVASSSDLLILFKDLSGSCEKIFHLLSQEDQEIALLVLRGRFSQNKLEIQVTEKEKITITKNKSEYEPNPSKMKKFSGDDVVVSSVIVEEKSEYEPSPSKTMKFSEDDVVDSSVFVEAFGTAFLDDNKLNEESTNKKTNNDTVSFETVPFTSKSIKPEMVSNQTKRKMQVFYCNRCNFQTFKSNSFHRHKQTHEKIVYKCEMCIYESTSSEILMKHMKTSHGEPVPLKCHLCDNHEENEEKLKEHMESQHQQKSDEEEELDVLQTDLAPMNFAKAKQYLIAKLPVWQGMGIFESPLLKQTLLEFGWELHGLNKPPKCNDMGRARLKELFK